MKKYNVPGECPVCGGELSIERIKCTNCKTEIIGDFHVSEFSKLDDKQLDFIKTFIKTKGNIKEMEKELGISYPTVRTRLDEISAALGIESGDESKKDNADILEMLEKGELGIEEALNIIKKKV